MTIGAPWRDDPLHDAVDGNFDTTTNADGMFVFEGVHFLDEEVQISASHPTHGASLHRVLAGGDETIELVLVPTGSIDGVIELNSALHGMVGVRGRVPELGDCSVLVRPSGRFVVENLVPGEYAIEVVQRPRWPERSARVTVVAGQRASVRITS